MELLKSMKLSISKKDGTTEILNSDRYELICYDQKGIKIADVNSTTPVVKFVVMLKNKTMNESVLHIAYPTLMNTSAVAEGGTLSVKNQADPLSFPEPLWHSPIHHEVHLSPGS